MDTGLEGRVRELELEAKSKEIQEKALHDEQVATQTHGSKVDGAVAIAVSVVAIALVVGWLVWTFRYVGPIRSSGDGDALKRIMAVVRAVRFWGTIGSAVTMLAGFVFDRFRRVGESEGAFPITAVAFTVCGLVMAVVVAFTG